MQPQRRTTASRPRAGVAARLLQSRFLLVVAALASAWAVKFSFVDVIALSPLYRYSGAIAYSTAPWSVPAAILFALLPVAWLKIGAEKASDFIVIYLYFLVYLPSCVLIPYTTRFALPEQLQAEALLLAAFALLEVRRLPIAARRGWALTEQDMFHHALILLASVMAGILLWFGGLSVQNLDLFSVYERRADLIGAGSSAPSVLFYAANFAGFAIAPMLAVYGLRLRRPLYVGAAFALALTAFAASSLKSHLFVTIMCVLAYAALSLFPRRAAANVVALGLLAVTLLVIAVDAAINYEPQLTWAIQFRIVDNNGFLTAKYFEYFWYNPPGYYADTFMRFFLESPYNRPIAQVVGESFSEVAGNHANGNLWADGFGNLKVAGVIIASLLSAALLLALDWLTQDKDAGIVLPLMTAIAFALANTSPTSALTSNGIVLLVGLLALLPVERGLGRRPEARNRRLSASV